MAQTAVPRDIVARRQAEHDACTHVSQLHALYNRWRDEDEEMARAQSAESRHIRSLERRLRKLEALFGDDSPLMKVIGTALGKAQAELRAEIAAVADRQLKFMGVYESGRSYQPNSLVVRSGGLWCALEATTGTPGQSTHWQLAVKQGEASR
jgi:hypothetical protein